MVVIDEATVCHMISRTALDGYPQGGAEKELFLGLLWSRARVYFQAIMGYCLMGNHFRRLLRTRPEAQVTEE